MKFQMRNQDWYEDWRWKEGLYAEQPVKDKQNNNLAKGEQP